MIDVSKINWAFIQTLAERGLEMPNIMRDIAKECDELTKWGGDNGFTSEECFDVLWPIVRTELTMPLPDRFVEARKQLAQIMGNRPKM